MARVGEIAREALDAAIEACTPGARTRDVDAAAALVIDAHGATSVRGVGARPGRPGFGGSVCVNVNEEAAHGTPGPRRMRDGDLVSVDVAIEKDGWWADVAEPVAVGEGSFRAVRVRDAAMSAFQAGLSMLEPGRRWEDVVDRVHEALPDLRLVRGLEGHGIGRSLHEAPSLTYDDRRRRLVLRPGMVFTVEPTVTDGSGETIDLDDGWTIATADRGWACFVECTVAIVRDGIRVLTGESARGSGGHGLPGGL